MELFLKYVIFNGSLTQMSGCYADPENMNTP